MSTLRKTQSRGARDPLMSAWWPIAVFCLLNVFVIRILARNGRLELKRELNLRNLCFRKVPWCLDYEVRCSCSSCLSWSFNAKQSLSELWITWGIEGTRIFRNMQFKPRPLKFCIYLIDLSVAREVKSLLKEVDVCGGGVFFLFFLKYQNQPCTFNG